MTAGRTSLSRRLRAVADLRLRLALQVIERLAVQVATNETERWAWRGWDGVVKSEPPSVVFAEQGTADFLPVRLGVLDARNGLAGGSARHGPAGFGDPDFLAIA